MSTIAPFPVRQMVYTNVEADQSPTRQRGFQIWQWSKELSLDLRKLIAKRLDDFRLPPGTVATDPEVYRFVFCHPAEDVNLIARSVPLTEKDKFGRGGKFFAHGVVLSDEHFKAIGCNPFRVLDGGFPFAKHPDEIKAKNPDWMKGELPTVTIQPADANADRGKSLQVCTLPLLAHVESDERPIVLPQKPAAVLAVLRNLFALLPPVARQRLTFDVLSNGASLQQIKYAIVGSYSPDVLKTWTFRRYVKLDVEKGEFTPKIEPKPSLLPQSLIFERDWSTLSDNDRQVLYDEARKLGEQKLDELKPNLLSPASKAVLDASTAARAAIDALVAKRIASEVPAAFTPLPTVTRAVNEWFVGSASQKLTRLNVEIPPKVIDDGVFAHLDWHGTGRPTDDVLEAIKGRLSTTENRKLKWICHRWRGAEDDVRRLEDRLASEHNPNDPNDPTLWLRGWIRDTLPTDLSGEGGLDRLLAKLEDARPLPANDVLDSQLFLACNPDPTNPHWVRAKLGVALAAGDKQFAAALQGLANSPVAADWLFAEALRAWKDRWIVGWADDGTKQLVGLFLNPVEDKQRAIVEAFVESGTYLLARDLFIKLWPDAVTERTPDDRRSEAEPSPPKELELAYDWLVGVGPRDRPYATEKLRETLRGPDNEGYRWAVNRLLMKVRGEWAMTSENDANGENEIWFVGLRLVWSMESQNAREVFAAAAGALVPEVRLGEPLPSRRPPAPRDLHRFSWLVSRLGHNISTQYLKIT